MLTQNFFNNFYNPLSIFILQLIIIMLTAKLLGFLFQKIGQPTVIGEIVAGVVLGPSLLGLFFPHFFKILFPIDSLNNLQFLSQLGLLFFMFIIGLELDVTILKNKAKKAFFISQISIIFPYILGIILAWFLFPIFKTENTSLLSFALFMGISLSITAFPVLARIIQEKNLLNTDLGILSLTSAAFNDVFGWCILAAIIAIVQASSLLSVLLTFCLALIYILFMFKIVKPYLQKLKIKYEFEKGLNRPMITIIFLILLGSAYLTQLIGIHALFGAFLASIIMPQQPFLKKELINKLEDLCLSLLLPLFFVYTGLRTQISLLNTPYLWLILCLVVFVAIFGKFVGSTLAAKYVGLNWRDSISIGALMNTRGLMELIVLNIGYDLKILSAPIFTILVLMALITTFMTAPILSLAQKTKFVIIKSWRS